MVLCSRSPHRFVSPSRLFSRSKLPPTSAAEQYNHVVMYSRTTATFSGLSFPMTFTVRKAIVTNVRRWVD